MFETNVTNNLKINAVSGTMVKNFRESTILSVNDKSMVFDNLFTTPEPFIMVSRGSYYKEKVYVVILQVMITGEGCYMVEVIRKEDFEKVISEAVE